MKVFFIPGKIKNKNKIKRTVRKQIKYIAYVNFDVIEKKLNLDGAMVLQSSFITKYFVQFSNFEIISCKKLPH